MEILSWKVGQRINPHQSPNDWDTIHPTKGYFSLCPTSTVQNDGTALIHDVIIIIIIITSNHQLYQGIKGLLLVSSNGFP
jgi:hypothetical protein